jgi:hypothetical protein
MMSAWAFYMHTSHIHVHATKQAFYRSFYRIPPRPRINEHGHTLEGPKLTHVPFPFLAFGTIPILVPSCSIHAVQRAQTWWARLEEYCS